MGTQIGFATTKSWNDGFLGRINLVNDASPMAGWMVAFDADFIIDKIWDAEIVSHVGRHYVIRNAAWNGDLAGNARTEFGFSATGSGAVTGLVAADPPAGDTAWFGASETWGSGFVGEITLQNDASALRGWTVAFDSAFEITDIWNAEIVSRVGSHYVVRNAGWNGDVAGFASTSFGFVAKGAGGPTNLVVGAPPKPVGDIATMAVTERWTGGFVSEVTVKNDGSAMHGWTVAFDAPFEISNIWNAEIVSHVGSRYVVKNVDWNSGVSSYGSTTFGFAAQGTGAATNMVVGAPLTPAGETATLAVNNRWTGGFGADVTVKNDASPMSSWVVEFDAPFQIRSIWNAEIVSHTGNHYVVKNAPWAGNVAGSGSTTFGFVADGGGNATGLVVHSTAPPPPPPTANGYSTIGNQIVDSTGQPVRLEGVNWFGMETATAAPDGLHSRNWQDMMDQMVDLGFNTIRLPFSLDSLKPWSKPANINYWLNPELEGLNSQQILDRIVDYAGDIGLKIILDNHRSAAGGGPNDNGRWYDSGYTEADWINAWKGLAARYAGNDTVIGVDLANEPHGATTWADWSAAAERAGNAVLSVNPDLLIIVEGVQSVGLDHYWWGGNLGGARSDPVVLNVTNKLVYSAHDYPTSVSAQPWFQVENFKDQLPDVFRSHWGYLFEENIAPVLLGEFGTKLQNPMDVAWLQEITQYLNGDFNTDGKRDLAANKAGISFAWWSWNPNSGDTGGILNDDWTTVNTDKLAYLDSLLGTS